MASVVALAFAMVSVSTFLVFLSVFGPTPKALAYNPSLPLDLYYNAPTISAVTGLAAALIAAIALVPDGLALRAAIGGLAVGVVVFFFVTVVTSNVMLSGGMVGDTSEFPAVRVSPPDVGVAVLVVGVIGFVYAVRSVSGRRLAVAALITGGVLAVYWLFSVLILNFSSE